MRVIKALLGVLLFHTGLYRVVFRRKAIIVVFHRVDDRYPDDPITCTRRKFAAFCSFFSRFFIVVPLSELLRKVRLGESIARHLVITFDDGYRDNHQTAAAELSRRQLPACFFVATAFIGSERVPWWDAAGGIKSEWMSWDQVHSLKEQGFEIGAHTCNHVDLGVVTGVEAEEEIVNSGLRLAQELETPVPFFSYPYGRRQEMTAANRMLIQKAGYSCCLSAFGGSVSPNADPFDVHRTPVSQWHLSTYQYGFELMVQH